MKLDPNKKLLTITAFDSASNCQKAGQFMAQHFPKVNFIHGGENVVSLCLKRLYSSLHSRNIDTFVKWWVAMSSYVSYLKLSLTIIFMYCSWGNFLDLQDMDHISSSRSTQSYKMASATLTLSNLWSAGWLHIVSNCFMYLVKRINPSMNKR